MAKVKSKPRSDETDDISLPYILGTGAYSSHNKDENADVREIKIHGFIRPKPKRKRRKKT